MTPSLPKIHELIKASWTSFVSTWDETIRISAWLILASVFMVGSIALSEQTLWATDITMKLVYLVGIVLTVLIHTRLYQIALDVSHGKPAERGFKQALPIIWPVILIAILSGLAMFGGFILLIIPGIYIGVRFGFAQLITIEKPFVVKETLSHAVVPLVVFIGIVLIAMNGLLKAFGFLAMFVATIYLAYGIYRLYKTNSETLRASWALTKNRFWQIFWKQAVGVILFAILVWIIGSISMLIVQMISGVDIPKALTLSNPHPVIYLAYSIINGAIQALTITLFVFYEVYLYRGLQKNGI